MAGHSKWKQIKRKKAVTDAKRGAVFTRIIREITIAAKAGGGDPAGNPRLRVAIDAAKAENMPWDNIDRAIKKGTGELEGVQYEEVIYEGYGPGGAAIMIEATTDNPNRTVAEIRHAFSRQGGNLGATNSVAWMFDRRAQITVDAAKADEDTTMEAALDGGAEDVVRDGDVFVITAPPAALHAVLAHFNVMTERNAVVFPGGPPVVKAATGADVTKEELGGPHIHVHQSGTIDNLAVDEEDALAQVRRFLSYMPSSVDELPRPRHAHGDVGGERRREVRGSQRAARRWQRRHRLTRGGRRVVGPV